MYRVVLLVFLWMFTSSAVQAEKRIALIIANSDYATTGWDLENPKNDAVLMRQALEGLEFEVHTILDANREEMERAFQAHGERLSNAGPDSTGFFFYAGHGVQSEGLNYLVPTDARAYSEADVWAQAPRLENFFRHILRAANERNFVVLDACRNNPLLSSSRNLSGGLATVTEAEGTLIAYATAPGTVAEDGDANSPYATALAALIAEPGQSVETLFRRVRTRVEINTNNRQRPWTESGLSGDEDYCFAGCAKIGSSSGTEAAAALRALNSGTLSELQSFLAAYPESSSRSLVEREIALLENGSEASEEIPLNPALTGVSPPRMDERWEQYAGIVVPGCETDASQADRVCEINKISWSPDGALIATATSDGMIRIFDPVTSQEISNWPSGYDIAATNIAWGPDSKQIAISSIWSDSVRVFDARRSAEIGRISLDGARSLRWDTKSQQLIVTHTDGISLVFFENGALLASNLTGNEHGVENVRDLATEGSALVIAGETLDEPIATFMQIGESGQFTSLIFPPAEETSFASRHVSSVDIAPDQSAAAVGTFNGWVYVFDLQEGTINRVLVEGEKTAGDFSSAINAVDWSPDGQRILVTDEDPRVRIFSASSGELVAALETNRFNAEDATFNPGGDRIAVSSIDGTFRLWRLIEE